MITLGTGLSILGAGLGILGTITSFAGGRILANEKEQRETDALINRADERLDKYLAERSSKE